jgi:hypothetical protein
LPQVKSLHSITNLILTVYIAWGKNGHYGVKKTHTLSSSGKESFDQFSAP